MGLVGVVVFVAEAVGQIGIDEQVLVFPFDEEATLAHPPKVEAVLRRGGVEDFVEENVVALVGEFHL